jgi:transposase
MPYIYGNRDQLTFLPTSIEDYVKVDDPVRAYDAFIDALEPADIHLALDEDQVGPPEYDPVSMLKLLVYGYSYGIRSSRKLERALHHNLSFIWLTGGLYPDHKTIARFRREHQETLREVMKQCARMCLRLGLVEGNILFVDGTKIEANASRGKSWSAEQCEKALVAIDQQIETVLTAIETIDMTEENHESMVKMQGELADQQELRKRVEDIAKEIQGRKNKKGSKYSPYNVVDPESRVIKSRKGTIQGYNGQIVCDDKNGIIVSTDVVNTSNDTLELATQIKQAENQLGKPCEIVVADTGYYTSEKIETLINQGKEVIIPTPRTNNRWSSEMAFDKETFQSDSQKDCYRCSQGKYLKKIRHDRRMRKIIYRIKKAEDCKNCIHWGKCTASEAGRSVVRLEQEVLREKVRAHYQKPDAQLIYKRRKEKVEHPFGDLKHNSGFKKFLLRGIQGVQTELAIWATHFNIRRMITILGGVSEFRKVLQSI